jgi:hypothetical protein
MYVFTTPSVSFYLSLDSVILHYPATNKKKRREYYSSDSPTLSMANRMTRLPPLAPATHRDGKPKMHVSLYCIYASYGGEVAGS